MEDDQRQSDNKENQMNVMNADENHRNNHMEEVILQAEI